MFKRNRHFLKILVRQINNFRMSKFRRGISSKAVDANALLIPISEIKRFAFECMQKVGAQKPQAEALANMLVEADYRGHLSHGINRLELYMNDLVKNVCNGAAEPVVLNERPSTALVDGKNSIGAYVSRFCMDLAIKKAKEVGIGLVACRGSNHFGIAGIYSMQAVKHGIIGMCFTNTSPLLSPTRSKQAVLGTNPFSIAAPGEKGNAFLFDMAATTVALGKIEMQQRKGLPIREGWAQGPDGKFTTDASLALKTACLMPLGGVEENAGYKGYGLAFLVEILCGILSGGAYGPDIITWKSRVKPANLSHCFMAIDLKGFEPGFETRLSDLMNRIRNLEPADPKWPVLVPGDLERKHMASVDKAGGIIYIQNQLDNCKKLAEKYQVKEMQPLRK